ncbi:MAG: hypothetical protein ABIK08_11260 [Pseudomonadota bacterium]
MNLHTHKEVALIHDLRKQANDAGMFVVEKPDAFLLYRWSMPRNVLVGKRSSLDGLRRLVRVAAGKH